MSRAVLVLAVALLAGCTESPTFKVGDCIGMGEFDHTPYRVTAVGARSYEIQFAQGSRLRWDLPFRSQYRYHLSAVKECEVQP